MILLSEKALVEFITQDILITTLREKNQMNILNTTDNNAPPRFL